MILGFQQLCLIEVIVSPVYTICNTKQVPRTSETYVHRSGRTARATKEGLSLLLIGPEDMLNFKKITKTLCKDEELPMFPIETKCMEAIKVAVRISSHLVFNF